MKISRAMYQKSQHKTWAIKLGLNCLEFSSLEMRWLCPGSALGLVSWVSSPEGTIAGTWLRPHTPMSTPPVMPRPAIFPSLWLLLSHSIFYSLVYYQSVQQIFHVSCITIFPLQYTVDTESMFIQWRKGCMQTLKSWMKHIINSSVKAFHTYNASLADKNNTFACLLRAKDCFLTESICRYTNKDWPAVL